VSETFSAAKPSSSVRILCGTPTWTISGVNIFLATLVRSLRARGLDARILLSNIGPTRDALFARPEDIPFEQLPLRSAETLERRCELLRRYLIERAPCVYLPGWDLEGAAITPTLPPEVHVVGILHSDDPWYYGMASSLGRYMDAVVCVSRHLADRIAVDHPELAGRCHRIPYGLPLPAPQAPRELHPDRPLRLLYSGRLAEHQKRVLDVPRILSAAETLGVPFEIDIAGEGPEGEAFRQAMRSFTERGSARLHGSLPNEAVLKLYESADVLLLPSAFEGLPLSLLECMARGCVPLTSDLVSGVDELVENGVSGFSVRTGDFRGFAERLARLHRDRALLSALSEKAALRIHEGPYTDDRMADAYQSLFEELTIQTRWRRPHGPVTLPPGRSASWSDSLPRPLRLLRQRLRRRWSNLP